MRWGKALIAIFIVGWLSTLLKHFWILPTFSDEDHDITGFEFKINFTLPNGKKQ